MKAILSTRMSTKINIICVLKEQLTNFLKEVELGVDISMFQDASNLHQFYLDFNMLHVIILIYLWCQGGINFIPTF